MTGATEVCRRAGDVSPSPARNDSGSGAMSVVVAVEKSLLRTLAFVLYQLDRNCAKYCASSILQWYMQLQTQLPVAAVNSLDRVADSVISLSDAQFTNSGDHSWTKSWTRSRAGTANSSSPAQASPHEHDISSTSDVDDNDVHEQEQHQLYVGIQRFFVAEPSDKGRTQTPCTSPVDLMDPSHRQPHSARHHYHDTDYKSECTMSDVENTEDEFEPGWAVEYMEQDSNIPSEMFRRMAEMMHSNVPANLFRATVTSAAVMTMIGI
ncbi:hypothetical protein GQ600_16275 [Phytophthora cactorum]|nr:hypothetical protein GQ600_16275 [Phytophthora cactorum]